MATKKSTAKNLSDGSAQVDAHLAKLPEPQRSTLQALRSTLLAILPHAEEKLSYSMPCVALQGKAVAGYDGFKDHCSYFPHSGNVLPKIEGLPADAMTTTGTLQFPVDEPLSASLVRKLVKVRMAEISDVSKGKRYDFYADGRLKAEGSMRDGQLHGPGAGIARMAR
ncbi:MAG: DUF1801 domain-containing protein [Acidimicrobiales bacterium]